MATGKHWLVPLCATPAERRRIIERLRALVSWPPRTTFHRLDAAREFEERNQGNFASEVAAASMVSRGATGQAPLVGPPPIPAARALHARTVTGWRAQEIAVVLDAAASTDSGPAERQAQYAAQRRARGSLQAGELDNHDGEIGQEPPQPRAGARQEALLEVNRILLRNPSDRTRPKWEKVKARLVAQINGLESSERRP